LKGVLLFHLVSPLHLVSSLPPRFFSSTSILHLLSLILALLDRAPTQYAAFKRKTARLGVAVEEMEKLRAYIETAEDLLDQNRQVTGRGSEVKWDVTQYQGPPSHKRQRADDLDGFIVHDEVEFSLHLFLDNPILSSVNV
jgi:hypothetical protein